MCMTNTQTDHATSSVAIGHILVLCVRCDGKHRLVTAAALFAARVAGRRVRRAVS